EPFPIIGRFMDNSDRHSRPDSEFLCEWCARVPSHSSFQVDRSSAGNISPVLMACLRNRIKSRSVARLNVPANIDEEYWLNLAIPAVMAIVPFVLWALRFQKKPD